MVLTHKICAWTVLLLGTTHVAYTAIEYRAWSLGAAWFLGAGLSFVFLGFLNLAAVAGSPRRTSWHSLFANLLALVYIVAVAAILPEPQALVGVVLLLVLLATTAQRLVSTK
jgi:ABC-type antimicrobial peptide transport system permease subunit